MIRFISFLILFSCSNLFAQSVGGNLSSIDTAKCVTGNNGLITLSGHTGNVIRWEYSYSGGDPWTPIINNTPFYNFSNLSQSTSFRAVVQQPSFLPVYSGSIKINVYSSTVGGIIEGENNICIGSTGLFQINGSSGKILYWEQSTSNGSTWNSISNSVDSISKTLFFSNNTWLRAIVKNGVCPTQNSTTKQITINSASLAGIVSGTDSICSTINSTNLAVSGNNGTIDWLYAYSNSGPWQSSSITTSNAIFNNQLSNVFYKVKVKNGACSEVVTPVFEVIHSQESFGGSITGISSVCANDTFTFNLVNQIGSITNWYYRQQGASTWITIPSNSSVLNFAISTPNSYEFRCSVKNGNCAEVMSGIKILTVQSLPTASFNNLPVCKGSQVTLTNISSNATSFNWDFGNGLSSTSANPYIVYATAGTFTIQLIASSNYGCHDTLSQFIHVFETPIASFLVSDSICANDQVSFINNSIAGQGVVSSNTWLDNGAIFSTSSNPNLVFANSGDHLISLQLQNSFGCTAYFDSTIHIFSKPIANFSFTNGCNLSVVNFVNQSTNTIGSLEYTWDFGDSGVSNQEHPDHNYSNDGDYNVLLIAKSNFNCSDTIIQQISIFPTPIIDFISNPVCKNDTMVFSPIVSPNSSYDFNWDFGDGFNSTDSLTNHLYSSFGQFNVELSVISSEGCQAVISKVVEVYTLPVAQFDVANICEGFNSAVQNYSYISNGSFTSEWSFDNSNLILGEEPSYLFLNSGVFPISLIVSSDNGCQDSLQKWINIYDSPSADFSFSNACNGIPIQFNNTSTVQSGIVSVFQWNFGDNSNSTLENPSKDFMNSGSYNVQLVVTSTNGCIDTVSHVVNSYDQPIANFGVGSVCFGEETVFDNQTILSLGSYESNWFFGDDSLSSIVSPSHTYQNPGNYFVKLIVESDWGCIDSIIKPVTVYYLPIVDAGEDSTISKGFSIELNATGANNYTWSPSFGLTNPQIANPISQPTESINYILIGESEFGCFNSDSVTITVIETFKVIPYNILTPDNNGMNDTWIVEFIESYPNNEVIIVNEIGQEVFRKKNYDNSWNGKNKTGEILPDGTYYFHLIFDDSVVEYKGDILLLRTL